MDGSKRALVSGGTSGLGYGVAKQLAARGWGVTIVGRDTERGAQIAAQIGGDFLRADLSLMSEVHRLARSVEGPLDALVLCAGGVSVRREPTLTSEGRELTFALNYLSKFALSQMLLPQLALGGCVVMAGGNGAYQRASTAWATRDAGVPAALKAALAVDIYAAQLASRAAHVRVHTCYPGMVRTNLFKDASFVFRLMARLFGVPIEQGSAHLTRLIVERYDHVHWRQRQPSQLAPQLAAGQAANDLWDYSQQIIAPYLQEPVAQEDRYAL